MDGMGGSDRERPGGTPQQETTDTRRCAYFVTRMGFVGRSSQLPPAHIERFDNRIEL